MPELKNTRHERFAQELAIGSSQLDAYAAAGYTPGLPSGAWRLAAVPAVKARVGELQAAAAAQTVTTIHGMAGQFDEDRQFARDCKAAAAAVSASMGKAKVLGLFNVKVEMTGKAGGPVGVSDTELARLIAFQLTRASK